MKFNPDYKPTIGKNQCVHGRLARNCKICELERENAELRETRDELRNILTNVMVKGWSKKGMWKRAEALVAGKGGKGK